MGGTETENRAVNNDCVYECGETEYNTRRFDEMEKNKIDNNEHVRVDDG